MSCRREGKCPSSEGRQPQREGLERPNNFLARQEIPRRLLPDREIVCALRGVHTDPQICAAYDSLALTTLTTLTSYGELVGVSSNSKHIGPQILAAIWTPPQREDVRAPRLSTSPAATCGGFSKRGQREAPSRCTRHPSLSKGAKS